MKLVYRYGYADLGRRDWHWKRRFGRWWAHLGPFIIGSVQRWDEGWTFGEPWDSKSEFY